MQFSLILVVTSILTATLILFAIVYFILRAIFASLKKARIQRLQEIERLRQEELERQRRYEEELAKQKAWERTPIGRFQSITKGVTKGASSTAKGVAEGAGNVLLSGAGILLLIALNKGNTGTHKRGVRVSGYKRSDGTYVKSYTRRKPR